MAGSVLHLPLAVHMTCVFEVMKLTAVHVRAMEVRRQAKTVLEQAISHSSVDERADARVTDAIPMSKDRLIRVMLKIGRQLALQHEPKIKAQ